MTSRPILEENTIVFCESQNAGKHSTAQLGFRLGSDNRSGTDREKKAAVAAHEDVVIVAVDLYGRGVGCDPVLHVIEIEVRLAQPAAVHHHLVT